MKGNLWKRMLAVSLAGIMTVGYSGIAAAAPAEEQVRTVADGGRITEDGVYSLPADAAGVIEVSAASVTIVGDPDAVYENLSILCTSAGTTLTIQDLQISANEDASDSVIEFAEGDNTLRLSGVNCMDSSSAYAVIRVGEGAELTLTEDSDSPDGGSLYLYKDSSGAGIGGDAGEENGRITFQSGKLFAVGEGAGALIGSGAEAEAAGGIVVEGGELYLEASGTGALIGGDSVSVSGGSIALYANGAGETIGGTVTVSGGSIRTNDEAVTDVMQNEDGNPVSLLTLDSTLFGTAQLYTVLVDGAPFYEGPLHGSSFDSFAYQQSGSTDPMSYWIASEDDNLYFYVDRTEHDITVNSLGATYTYDEDADAFFTDGTLRGVYTAVTGEGEVDVSLTGTRQGDTVTVTAAPEDGYYPAQLRLSYGEEDNLTWETLTPAKTDDTSGTVYTFTLPDDCVTVTADFVSVVWDGTVDLTWYDPDADTYEISYGAQLAGAAALVNGIFNNYPTTASETLKNVYIPDVDEEGHPSGYSESLYNVYTSDQGTTVVVGDITLLEAVFGTGETSGENNQTTTDDYWYGAEDFSGKTILLTADLDMGGVCTGDTTEITDWSGPNYMPIGGQYSMDTTNSYTRLSASFNGDFNGQGHMVYNIYCYRYANLFGDSQAIGLIGRMGTHDNDSKDRYASPAVENVAVDGIIYGRRSVGGIVGKNGQSNGSVIRNCINFATVKNTDAKGLGGIAGSGWNNLIVQNCVNFGYICTSYNKNAGGIIGNSEATVVNCYNFGYVGADNSNKEAAQSLGTNNGGAIWRNCYYLTGSSAATVNPAIYNPTRADLYYAVETPELMKGEEFLESLNGTGRDWTSSADCTWISDRIAQAMTRVHSYTSGLLAYDVTGMPVPRIFIQDDTVLERITVTGTPVTDYVEGQTFDVDTLLIRAQYSDGTGALIEDYTVIYENGEDQIALGDTRVTLSGTYDGVDYSYTYPITVEPNELERIVVATLPTSTLYSVGESFDITGMVVRAYYTNGLNSDVTAALEYSSEPLSGDTAEITFYYTYKETTQTVTVPITMLESEAPEVIDGTVRISTVDDMRWFANQVTNGADLNAVLLNDVDLTGSGLLPIGRKTESNTINHYYAGIFDGAGYTVTLSCDSANYYSGLFAGITDGAVIKDLSIAGTVTGSAYTGAAAGRMVGGRIENVTVSADVTATGDYTGGIAGYAAGENAEITACVNTGSVTSDGKYVGGITGYAGSGLTVADCRNTAAVTGYDSVGGIAGYERNASVTDCENKGAVTSTSNQTLNGVCKSDGVWAYYVDGQIQTSYTGFQKNANGWWYIKNGYVDFGTNSVIRDKDTKGKSTVDGTFGWWYVVSGKVQLTYTGVANYKNANGWWYIKKGKVDFSANTVAKNKNGWWYVVGGKVQLTYTGVANYKNANGWWYVKNGKVDFSANTVAKNKNGWWKVTKGKVDFSYTGLANNASGWWYVKGGLVQFTYTGIQKNSKGSWYVKKGKVQFGYSGKVTVSKKTYTVKKGKVVSG